MDSKNKFFYKIKSKFIFQKIFGKLKYNKSLKILKYCKTLQSKFDLDLNSYKDYYEQIEIEIIPNINFKYASSKNYFINIKRGYKCYYHIYINNNSYKQYRKTYFTEKDDIYKIKVIIDNEIKSFENLFHNCSIIQKINFIKFKRNDITNMSYMFSGCSILEEINFSDFITDNVINMSYMFYKCRSLKEINLCKFKTNKLIDMSGMF